MKIVIKDLTFEAILGILRSEREKPQKIKINLEIDYEYSKGDFLDYVKIINLIENDMKRKRYKLIEDAILEITKLLKKEYDLIRKIDMEISKPTIIKNAETGIRYEAIFCDKDSSQT